MGWILRFLSDLNNNIILKNIFLIIFLIFSVLFSAQNETADRTDKIADEMCSNLKQSENLSDSTRIQILNDKYILPYLSEFPEKKRKSIADNLYMRFQKRCEYFREYLLKSDHKQSDNWIKLDQRPKITITEKEIDQLKNSKELYYFEYSGTKRL